MSGRRPRHLDDADPGPRRWRGRLGTGALTLAVHVVVFGALFWPRAVPPVSRNRPPPPPSALQLSVVELPVPKPPAPPEPAMLQPASPVSPLRPHITMPSPVVMTEEKTPDTSDLLTESQLRGAAAAGEGGGGGCDIAHAVQQALRRDPMVRRAVEDAHRLGKAIMLWNGDWVRSGDQDGKGLSAVREAITWEVAFAPAACRNIRMHGLVLLSLGDGRTRFAVGAGEWRWSDLLGVREGLREQ